MLQTMKLELGKKYNFISQILNLINKKMYSIHDEEKIKELFKEAKIANFRYAQIENAIYKNFITDFDEIQTIPKDLREFLKSNFYYNSLEVDHIVTSEN
jgi:adenine C2-methylase RlmN of 23S rRNA A2503 and tRNA A37